jgi:SAM-dependent methyltransferase
MTQPSVHTSFDTSLVDLHPNISFSTTESDPSDAGMSTTTQANPTSAPSPLAQDIGQTKPQASQAIPPKTSTPVQHIGTQDAYDQWASVYDTDGNMLQSIDDDELNTLLPPLLDKTTASSSDSISVLDLGCGTGRNTARLLAYAWPADKSISVTGLDFSAGMLLLASSKLAPLVASAPNLSLRLEQCNPFPSPPSPRFSPQGLGISQQHLVLSTLVLEHIPLDAFFSTLTTLLAPGGTALLTNMHADMGAVSQAGFVNAEGVKVRGESFVYTLAQTVQAAQDVGLQVVVVRERRVGREDVERGVVGKRGEKWMGVKVWFGVVVKKT